MISVIVPIYNVENYLDVCIESILHQSYPNIELILIDDGSTDESAKICQKYKNVDDRIVFKKQKHQGPFYARKAGVNLANGEYVTFVDADDYLDECAYEYAIKEIEEEIDLICFGMHRLFEDRCIETNDNYEKGIYDSNEVAEKIYPTMIWDTTKNSFGLDPSLCNKIIKRDILLQTYENAGNIEFHYGEDVAIIYPIIMKVNSISLRKEAYYYHRQRLKTEIAPYIKDPFFLDNLFLLYKYLLKKMGKSFQEQIEEFYAESVQLNGKKYGIKTQNNMYLFPFDKVNKGERIVIYGAGDVGTCYISQVRKINYCKIEAILDRNYKLLSDEVRSPDEIRKIDFDKVIVAISDSLISKSVHQYLMSMGVKEEKIIV